MSRIESVMYDPNEDRFYVDWYATEPNLTIAATAVDEVRGSGAGLVPANNVFVDLPWLNFPANGPWSYPSRQRSFFAGENVQLDEGKLIVKIWRGTSFTQPLVGTAFRFDRTSHGVPTRVSSRIPNIVSGMRAFLTNTRSSFMVEVELVDYYEDHIVPQTNSAISKLEEMQQSGNFNDEMIDAVVGEWEIQMKTAADYLKSGKFATDNFFPFLGRKGSEGLDQLGEFSKLLPFLAVGLILLVVFIKVL